MVFYSHIVKEENKIPVWPRPVYDRLSEIQNDIAATFFRFLFLQKGEEVSDIGQGRDDPLLIWINSYYQLSS